VGHKIWDAVGTSPGSDGLAMEILIESLLASARQRC
jgi:hypothetical protein